ncbi:helix-turn-helix transcriptional regulator [Bradyrhizobium sp. WYCCWR 13022]|uniref:helix-turn-helix domain-containing protein n=1 Tax=unclassified Bradyrhizobium TaxID=2631580 RepID=UPI00263A5441|nr:helix-turn-helix transcriptional regulator [Bradyrhizobium sp. WYCCWR 13022]MDN4984655.1 helix-turn-helix transcriptional regulator [Bradyrhizobium sp. WYCCWR 13022]
MAKELVQHRIQKLREAAGLDRHHFAARIGKSYTAVWNWETKGTATTFVPEDASIKAIASEFAAEVEMTPEQLREWLRDANGKPPMFKEGTGEDHNEAKPNVHMILESIRELEKLPEVRAYSALLKSLKVA